MTTTQRLELVDLVRELTEPHKHAEHYQIRRGHTWYGENHNTTAPPLLLQLLYASPSGLGDERSGGGYESRPAARIEAVDTLIQIDHEAARWVRQLGEDDPGDRLDLRTGQPIHGSGTIACIRLLSGLAAGARRCTRPRRGCCTFHDIERAVRRWWMWARIATGWDSPSWRPRNTCPVCGERGTLRVNLVAQIATCVHDQCRETWDETSIGILAEHIRAESEAERTPLAEPAPCLCRLPRIRQARWGLCPTCGSAYCTGAEEAAEREAEKRAEAAEDRRLRQLEEQHLLAVKHAVEAAGARRGA